MAVVYRDDICGTQLHRQVYNQVRMTLGQAALSSPLGLDDLNAMFIMSNNANTPNHVSIMPPNLLPPFWLSGTDYVP